LRRGPCLQERTHQSGLILLSAAVGGEHTTTHNSTVKKVS
jgi:hypothetical protein